MTPKFFKFFMSTFNGMRIRLFGGEKTFSRRNPALLLNDSSFSVLIWRGAVWQSVKSVIAERRELSSFTASRLWFLFQRRCFYFDILPLLFFYFFLLTQARVEQQRVPPGRRGRWVCDWMTISFKTGADRNTERGILSVLLLLKCVLSTGESFFFVDLKVSERVARARLQLQDHRLSVFVRRFNTLPITWCLCAEGLRRDRSGMCRTGDTHHGKTADVSLTAEATERFTQRSLDSAKCWQGRFWICRCASSLGLNVVTGATLRGHPVYCRIKTGLALMDWKKV